MGYSSPSLAASAAPAAPAAWQAPPQRQVVVVSQRIPEGLLVGAAAAGIAGVLWWASVAFTERQFVYGAILVGIIVGQGVLIGARKGGVVPGVIAAVLTLAALVCAEYFIQRSLAISQYEYDLALWTDFGTAKTIVQEAVEADPLTALFWGISAFVALFSAGASNKHPLI